MQFEIEGKTFLNAASAVNRTVEAKSTIPILANFHIKADGKSLAVRGTNLDIETAFEVDATVKTPGSITVPAHLLFGILRKLPEGAVIKCKLDKETLTLKSGRSRFTLQTLPDTDFPDLQAGDLPIKFGMPGEAVRNMLKKVSFAISTEETRYYLNGIHLHPTEDALVAVTTDGHRLAKHDMPMPEGAAELPPIIIPRKTCQLLQGFTEKAENVAFECSKSKIKITVGDVTMISKLIDGTFPDYTRVIPTSNEKLAKVSRAWLHSAVDRVATISTERGRATKLSFKAGKLALEVVNPDCGSATEEIEIEYGAEPIDIGFNSRYLMDICANIGGDEVNIKLGDPGSPTLFLPAGDVSSLYVLMPMRV